MENKVQQKFEKLLENTGDMALKRRARRIIEELNPQNGDRILDVGCGDGFYLHLLSNLGLKINLAGVDYSKPDLKRARKNLKKGISLFQADLMDKLPFGSDSFDKVVMSEVLEHLPNDVKGLTEVKRVLRPDGILVVSVPNHNYPFLWDPVNWILEDLTGGHIRSGFWAGIWSQHQRLYTPEQIRKVVQKAGFEVEEVKSLIFWCLPFNHNLVHLVARFLYSGNLNLSMEKAISKYETKVDRPFFLDAAFWLVNVIDKLNDLFPVKSSGVGVFIKAKKP